jgi:sec-independent protein translocase protein TatA
MQLGMLAFLGPIGLPELLIIMVILFFIFGANRLSGIGKGMGQAIRGFKEEIKADDKTQKSAESQGSE